MGIIPYLYLIINHTNRKKFIFMKIDAKIAETITSAFIAGLQAGKIPWKRGWKNGKGGKWVGIVSDSVNVQTGKHYNGINAMLLDCRGLEVPVWGTFKQWQGLKLSVKKGEKGTPTVFYSWFFVHKTDKNKKVLSVPEWMELSDTEKAQYTKLSKLRYDYLFHIGQVDGEKYPAIFEKWSAKFAQPKTDETTENEPEPFNHELSELVVANWGLTLKHENQNRAYYSPALDFIMMPTKAQFDTESDYYETLFHEGIHATGHQNRLNRESLTEAGRFGDANYSFEELVAEIGSAYVCGHLGVEQQMTNKQAYINNWIEKLGKNPEWIIKASQQANKAAGWILSCLDSEQAPVTVETHEEAKAA